MNPEREILNFWLNRQGYLTTNNIKVGMNKEIYLVAVKLEGGKAVDLIHIEAQVSVGNSSVAQLRTEAGKLIRKKFEDASVRKKMKSILDKYGIEEYRKVMVFGARTATSPIKKAMGEKGIETMDFSDIISESVNALDGQVYHNHTVRTLQLMKFLLLSSPEHSASLINGVMSRTSKENLIENITQKNPTLLSGRALAPVLNDAFRKSALRSPKKLAAFLSEGMTKKSYNALVQELKDSKPVQTQPDRKSKERSLRSFLQ